jgi:flagellar biosynthesis protein FliQ
MAGSVVYRTSRATTAAIGSVVPVVVTTIIVGIAVTIISTARERA